ncbi:MAG: hypothetical protein ABSE71_03035 [Candidatus Micrarchaeaceae archaeon]|nr:hypothetical protein [Candidatus Micrarchaeota archaeon]HII10051.1 hypothetical protein [Candidatus Micrarchaeota archaeon]
MKRIMVGPPVPSVCMLRPPVYNIELNNGRSAVLEVRDATDHEKEDYGRATGGINGKLHILSITEYRHGLNVRDLCCLNPNRVMTIDLTEGQDLRSRIEEEVNRRYNRDGLLGRVRSFLRG